MREEDAAGPPLVDKLRLVSGGAQHCCMGRAGLLHLIALLRHALVYADPGWGIVVVHIRVLTLGETLALAPSLVEGHLWV